MKPSPAHPPEITIIDDAKRFAALEEEWEDLYRDAPLATPFQSWAWLYSWWEFYGEGYELRLITVREEGLLVGVVPLMLKRWWGFGRLLFVGTGITDYLDVLARGGWEERVSEAARDALWRIGSWQVAELHELRPSAVAWGIFNNWSGPRTRIHQTNCPVIEVKPWDELLMSVSKRLRSSARQALRRGEEDGVRWVLAGPEEAERAARRLVALHREMMQGRDILPERLTPRWDSLMVAAARRMTARGLGGISECWRDGEVIISAFRAFGNGVTFGFKVGASGEARLRYQWSSLDIWQDLNIARNTNSAYLSLGQAAPHKQRWAPRKVPVYQTTLGRGPVSWGLYGSYRSLRGRLETELRRRTESGSAPKWIGSAAAWLRGRLRT